MRVVTGLVLIAIIVTATIAYFAWASTPTTDIWISPGVYPGAPSYTIWREGSNYFAKNENGHIIHSGTNASDIINTVYAQCDYYDTIQLQGEVTITNSIVMNGIPVNLLFDELVLDTTMTDNGIEIVDLSYWATTPGQTRKAEGGISIKGNYIRVMADNTTWDASAIYLQNCVSVKIEVQKIFYLPSGQESGVGIEFFATQGEHIMGCSIIDVWMIRFFTIGIYWHTNGTGYINGNSIINTYAGTNSIYCLKLYNDGNGIGGNTFSGFVADAPDAAGYGIHIAKGPNAVYDYIEYNVFIGYRCWDSQRYYYADNYTKFTTFLGFFGGFVGGTWDDEGIHTSIWGGTDQQAIGYGSFGLSDWMVLRNMTHPNTGSWGMERQGRIWFDTTYNAMMFWNGTHCIYWNATGTGVQP